MGGFGSGRSSGFGRDTAESCRALDVNDLHRRGCLEPGWCGGLTWSRNGEQIAAISMRMDEDCLVLDYNYRFNGGDWQSVEEAVRVPRVPCRYGGSRPYFLCPGVVNGVACGRRVAKLYGPGRYFLCRHCYGLAYTSQRENTMDRAMRRARKIRERLGGEAEMDAFFPPRPKGMWNRTYERLKDEVIEIECAVDAAFAERASRLVAQIDRRNARRSSWR